jgi:hypothetical protein
MLRRPSTLLIAATLVSAVGCNGMTAAQVATLGATAQVAFEKKAEDIPLTPEERAALKVIRENKPHDLRVDLPKAAIPALLSEAANAFMPQGAGGGTGGSGESGTTAPPTCVGTTIVATGSGRSGLPTLPQESSSRDMKITDCLADGQSVCGADAPAAIVADINCGQITLNIVGEGFAVTKSGDRDDDHDDNGNHGEGDRGRGNDKDDDQDGNHGEGDRGNGDEDHGSGFRTHGNDRDGGDDHDRGNGNDDRGDGDDHDRGNGNDRNDEDDRDRDDDKKRLKPEEIGPAYTPPDVPGFTASTWVIEKARHVVLLDDTIAMTPVVGAAPSDEKLVMSVATKWVLDFMLAGQHTVTVVRPDGNWVRAPIRFGKPNISSSLSPQITAARLIKQGDDTSDWLIQINGGRLPIDFRKVYCKLGNQRTYYRATFLGSQSSVGYIHVPGNYQQPVGGDTLTLITPFGMTFATVK